MSGMLKLLMIRMNGWPVKTFWAFVLCRPALLSTTGQLNIDPHHHHHHHHPHHPHHPHHLHHPTIHKIATTPTIHQSQHHQQHYQQHQQHHMIHCSLKCKRNKKRMFFKRRRLNWKPKFQMKTKPLVVVVVTIYSLDETGREAWKTKNLWLKCPFRTQLV